MRQRRFMHRAAGESPRLEEYRQVSENLRLYANLRFAQMTLFFVATGALLAALGKEGGLARFFSPPAFAVGGLVVVAAFAVMEQSAVRYWFHYRGRAVELERDLGLRQYTDRARKLRLGLSATSAVRFLFFGVAVVWLAVASQPWFPQILAWSRHMAR